MKTKILATAIITAALISSCKTERKPQTYGFEETEQEGLPYGVTDTINGEVVSDECAIMNHDLEYLLHRVESVKSPDMLMMLKADFEHTLDSLTLSKNDLTSEEQTVITDLCSTIKSSYANVCKEYEIPADGVIDNLKRCINKVNQANSRNSLILFTESRRGMLRNLDIIHLCVESNSGKIPEVKRLAQQLKSTLETKKKQYNL